jgi:hypothetical protein
VSLGGARARASSVADVAELVGRRAARDARLAHKAAEPLRLEVHDLNRVQFPLCMPVAADGRLVSKAPQMAGW